MRALKRIDVIRKIENKRLMSKPLIIGIMLSIAIAPIHGTESHNIQKKISMDEAVQIAMANNHDYKIAGLKLKEADEKVNQAWGTIIPVLESEASVARQNAENGLMSLSDGQNDIKLIQLKFGINPGSFYNSLQLSRKGYISAEEEARRIRDDISFKVIKGYFAVITAQEIVKLRKDSLNLLKENLKDVQNMYKTGSVPRFELLQAQGRLTGHEPLVLEAKNNYRISIDTFNYYLGLDKREYTADDSILNSDNFKVPTGVYEETVIKLSQFALKNRPEIIQIKNKSAMASYSRDIARSYYLWPSFSIAGYYGKTQFLPESSGNPMVSQIAGNRDWQTTWQVQVAATYRWGSLFPVDSKQSEKREKEAQIREAEEELLKLKKLIDISIKTSYSNLVTSYYSIISHKENVKTSEEGLRIAQESYRAGILKNSDLLSAEVDLTNARMGFIQAVNQYYVSIAALKKEIGSENEYIIFKGGKDE